MIIARDENSKIVVFSIHPACSLKNIDHIKVATWDSYGKHILVFSMLHTLILSFGLALLLPNFFRKDLFSYFFLLITAAGVIKIFRTLKVKSTRISHITHISIAPPLAIVDWSAFYLSISLLPCIYFINFNTKKPHWILGGSIFFLILSLAPLFNFIALKIGGKMK